MEPNNSADKKRAERSLDTLFNIFKEISNHADEVIKNRCPYKNAKSRCTAKFECKNQHYIKKFGEKIPMNLLYYTLQKNSLSNSMRR